MRCFSMMKALHEPGQADRDEILGRANQHQIRIIGEGYATVDLFCFRIAGTIGYLYCVLPFW